MTEEQGELGARVETRFGPGVIVGRKESQDTDGRRFIVEYVAIPDYYERLAEIYRMLEEYIIEQGLYQDEPEEAD